MKDAEKMILAFVTAAVAPEKHKEFAEEVGAALERVRREPGCLGCRLAQDTAEAKTFLLVEWWAGREDLERHLRSSGFKAVRAAFALSLAPPAIQFITVSRTEGTELIDAGRRSQPGRPPAAGRAKPRPAARPARASESRRCGSAWVFGPVLDGRTGYGMRWK